MASLINLSDSYTILIALILFVLILMLAKETKKSILVGIMLMVFLIIIVGHTIEFAIIQDATGDIVKTISKSIAMDFVFIFLSFISYLWIDDIETNDKKKKSIDNSLDWFWKKV